MLAIDVKRNLRIVGYDRKSNILQLLLNIVELISRMVFSKMYRKHARSTGSKWAQWAINSSKNCNFSTTCTVRYPTSIACYITNTILLLTHEKRNKNISRLRVLESQVGASEKDFYDTLIFGFDWENFFFAFVEPLLTYGWPIILLTSIYLSSVFLAVPQKQSL